MLTYAVVLDKAAFCARSAIAVLFGNAVLAGRTFDGVVFKIFHFISQCSFVGAFFFGVAAGVTALLVAARVRAAAFLFAAAFAYAVDEDAIFGINQCRSSFETGFAKPLMLSLTGRTRRPVTPIISIAGGAVFGAGAAAALVRAGAAAVGAGAGITASAQSGVGVKVVILVAFKIIAVAAYEFVRLGVIRLLSD